MGERPASVEKVSGKDTDNGPVDVSDNPMYAELEKYL